MSIYAYQMWHLLFCFFFGHCYSQSKILSFAELAHSVTIAHFIVHVIAYMPMPHSGPLPYSGPISYSGPIPYSGPGSRAAGIGALQAVGALLSAIRAQLAGAGLVP